MSLCYLSNCSYWIRLNSQSIMPQIEKLYPILLLLILWILMTTLSWISVLPHHTKQSNTRNKNPIIWWIFPATFCPLSAGFLILSFCYYVFYKTQQDSISPNPHSHNNHQILTQLHKCVPYDHCLQNITHTLLNCSKIHNHDIWRLFIILDKYLLFSFVISLHRHYFPLARF